MKVSVIGSVACLLACLGAAPASAASCESLATLALKDAKVTGVTVVGAPCEAATPVRPPTPGTSADAARLRSRVSDEGRP
jgi:hypothetical protein